MQPTAESARRGTPRERHPVGRQRWRDLLFLHRPVPGEVLRPLIPPGLTVDTYEGEAWATLIPFAVTASRPRGLPRWLGMSFLEVNLRTYVRGPDGERGIYFFSLDASSRLAVAGARLAYALPYHPAAMRRRVHADGATIRYRSVRGRPGGGAELQVEWQVGAPTGPAAAGSLDHFLVERYVLFAARGRRLYRARVRHRPYPLSEVSVGMLRESLLASAGLPSMPSSPPLVHHSPGVDVEIFWRHRLRA